MGSPGGATSLIILVQSHVMITCMFTDIEILTFLEGKEKTLRSSQDLNWGLLNLSQIHLLTDHEPLKLFGAEERWHLSIDSLTHRLDLLGLATKNNNTYCCLDTSHCC